MTSVFYKNVSFLPVSDTDILKTTTPKGPDLSGYIRVYHIYNGNIGWHEEYRIVSNLKTHHKKGEYSVSSIRTLAEHIFALISKSSDFRVPAIVVSIPPDNGDIASDEIGKFKFCDANSPPPPEAGQMIISFLEDPSNVFGQIETIERFLDPQTQTPITSSLRQIFTTAGSGGNNKGSKIPFVNNTGVKDPNLDPRDLDDIAVLGQN